MDRFYISTRGNCECRLLVAASIERIDIYGPDPVSVKWQVVGIAAPVVIERMNIEQTNIENTIFEYYREELRKQAEDEILRRISDNSKTDFSQNP